MTSPKSSTPESPDTSPTINFTAMKLTDEMPRGEDLDMSYFTRRRSMRNFHPEPVDDELIGTIVRQAMKAPTTGNMQLYSVVATRRPESAVSGTKPGFGNLQGFLYGLFDATILTQQISTIAELHGLGTCILGTTAFNAPEIADLLQLPSGVVPLLTLAVGVPDGDGEPTERLPLDGVLHWEKYADPTDAEIAEIYSVKDDFAPNRQYVTENHKPSLAHVFTEVRYPEAMNSEFSAKLDTWLRAQGINL